MSFDLLDGAVPREIIGRFYAVYNGLGYGLLESVYARGLEYEVSQAGLHVVRETPVNVFYRRIEVGHFRADLLVEHRVLVEVKASPALVASDTRQILNYLTASRIQTGLLLHFGPKPAFKRFVVTHTPSKSGSADGRGS